MILTALFAHPDCTSLPSIESCLPLFDQCVHVGKDETSSASNQAPPKTFYCKGLIIVVLGGSPNSNHFFLIEEVKPKKFRVYDNLRGNTWIKRSEIGKKHKVYGLVLCAQKRTPATFSFDPAIYANVAKPTKMMWSRSVLVVILKPLVLNVLRVECKLVSDSVRIVKVLLTKSTTKRKILVIIVVNLLVERNRLIKIVRSLPKKRHASAILSMNFHLVQKRRSNVQMMLLTFILNMLTKE